eukprot:1136955-Pelagomonas_calceolata.AAC.3
MRAWSRGRQTHTCMQPNWVEFIERVNKGRKARMTWLMQCAVCSVHPRSRQKDVISQPHSSSLIATCSNAHACTPFSRCTCVSPEHFLCEHHAVQLGAVCVQPVLQVQQITAMGCEDGSNAGAGALLVVASVTQTRGSVRLPG